MSNHTRGPWRVYTHDLYHHEVMADTKAIATVGTLDEDYGIEAANARLIAAAPDLLAATRMLVAYIRQNGWPGLAPPECYQEALRSIAKADGTQP